MLSCYGRQNVWIYPVLFHGKTTASNSTLVETDWKKRTLALNLKHSTSPNLVHESFPESLAVSRKSGEVIEQTLAICFTPCQKCSTLYPHTGSCTDFLNGICHLIRTQPGGRFSGPSCYDTTHFVALSNWFCSLVHQVSYHCFSFVFALAFLNSKFLTFIDIFYF